MAEFPPLSCVLFFFYHSDFITFFFPPKTFCKSESEAEATFFSQIDMYNLLINFQPIFCV